MKKIIAILLLIPTFSQVMEKSHEVTGRKIESIRESADGFSQLAVEQPSAGLADSICPDDFLNQFRDMRYYHLNYPPMKALLKTSLKYALLHGNELWPIKAVPVTTAQWERASVILHRAQGKVAYIIEKICAKNDFLANVEYVSESVDEKFVEEFPGVSPWQIKKAVKKGVVGVPLSKEELINNACWFYAALQNYDTITGTTLKDMAAADQPVGRRLCEKIRDLLIKGDVDKQTYVDLRAKFFVEGDTAPVQKEQGKSFEPYASYP